MIKSNIKNKFSIGSITLSIIVSIYMALIFNKTFWLRIFALLQNDYLTLASVIIATLCIIIILTITFSVKYFIKPFLIFLILVSCIASWFTDQFGVIIDRDMIANAVGTTISETKNYISLAFVWHLFLTAIIPSCLIIWVKIKHQKIFKKVIYNFAVIMIFLVILIGSILLSSRQLISTFRANGTSLSIINPIFPIVSSIKYVIVYKLRKPMVFKNVGLDAKINVKGVTSGRPRVLVIVAGETARAISFSLQGYSKETNPGLKRDQVIYFSNTSSCGTATAQSIPCMFSPYTKSEFTVAKANSTSSLPDILAKVGINVEWWDNNTGSQGVANNIKNVTFYGSNDPKFCIDGECHDGIMLDKLNAWLDGITSDSVLIIHQLGSHGPAYFKRYPKEFAHFQPDCRGLNFNDCSVDEIRNAYDNTILYTDFFLSTIINNLKDRANTIDGALFYMSDHGESLGEKGLFLHGMPYALAPTQQTHIPFVLWMAPPFEQAMNINENCLRKNAATQSVSHDVLFPSVLTMMNIDTSVKDKNLDIFEACKGTSSLSTTVQP